MAYLFSYEDIIMNRSSLPRQSFSWRSTMEKYRKYAGRIIYARIYEAATNEILSESI